MAKTLTQEKRSLQHRARTRRESQRFVTRHNERYEANIPVQSGVSAGKNLVSVNGQYYPAEGIDGAGGAVAVVNVGTPAVAKYAPPSNRSVIAVAGTGRGGSGGGGGGGPTYSAGSGIDIDGLNAINVKRDIGGAIGVGGSGGIMVNVGDGIKILSNALTLNLHPTPGLEYGSGVDAGKVRVKVGDGIALTGAGVILNLAATPGLEIGSGADAGKVQVKTYFGLQRTSNGVGILLPTLSGLFVDGAGLVVADSLAGNGLDIAGKVMFVGAGDGIDVFTNTIAVDANDITGILFGLEVVSNDIRVKRDIDSGMTFALAGGLKLGTPSTVSVISSNLISGITHNHAVASSSDVGTIPTQSLLASTIAGALTLAQLTLRGNLIFAGGDRFITASNNLTISPSTDLILDPSGLILAPNAQDIRTITINDLPTGIDGFRIWNRYANYTQLTIGAIKADELYVRVFTADETRIDRGEEYWSKSFGIIQTDFTLPAVNSTVDVWFEDAPAATTFNLFAVNDYLLCRTIDWGTGLVVQKVWFQVTTAKLAQETSDPLVQGSVDRQKWRIKRLAGGIDGSLIKRGNLMLDAGAIGQGWIHLSALSQDGGPFIQIGTMTSVSTVPQFTNYVRMGNLNGTVDYATNVYGFAAGSGSGGLGTTPSGGFSGVTVEATNGARLFNTSFLLYNGSTLAFSIDKNVGIRLLQDGSEYGDGRRYIKWYDSISPLGNLTGELLSYTDSGTRYLRLREIGPTTSSVHATFAAENASQSASFEIDITSASSTASIGAKLILIAAPITRLSGDVVVFTDFGPDQKFFGIGVSSFSPASTLHVREVTTNTGASAGVTIEQNSTGDALLQFLLTGGTRWVAGIDNSDSDKFKIGTAALGSGDKFVIDTTGNVGIGITAPVALVHIADTNTIGGTSIVTSNLSVGNLSIHTTDVQAIDVGAMLVLGGMRDNAAVSPGVFGGIRGAKENGTTANNAGYLAFYTLQSGVAFAERMRISSIGLVGIGTTPVSTLHVYESTTATTTAAGLTIEQASTGDAKLQFLLTGGQRWGFGIDNSDSDKLKITSGTDLGTSPILTFTTDGHIGINSADPANNLIGTTDLTSNLVFRIDSTQPAFVVRSTGFNPSINLIHTAAPTDQKWLRIYASTGGVSAIAAYDDSNVLAFSFLSMDHGNGFVGINETAPGTQLEIGTNSANLVRLNNYGTAAFHLIGRRANGTQSAPSAVSSGDAIFTMGAVGYTSGGWATNTSGEISIRSTESFNTGTTGKGGAEIRFYTRANGAASVVQRMAISNGGRVGIGDVAIFGAKLTVSNDLSEAVDSIWMSSYGTNNIPTISGRAARGTLITPTALLSGDILMNVIGVGRYDSANYGVASATMRFIATENFSSTHRGTKISFQVTDNGLTTPSPVFEILQDGGLIAPVVYGDVISTAVRDLQIDSTGRFGYVTSALRYKTDIRSLDIERSADLIGRLRPILYKDKNDGQGRDQFGFIAEEVLAAGGSELVIFGDGGVVESLDYKRFVVPTIGAMQHIMAELASVKAELAELKGRWN